MLRLPNRIVRYGVGIAAWACGCVFLVLLVGSHRSILAQANLSAPREQQEIIDFLNKSVEWYQSGEAQERIARAPGDVFFLNSNKPIAEQVVHLSFDFARARAAMAGTAVKAARSTTADVGLHFYNLSQNAAQLETQANTLKADLDSLQKKQQTATGSQRKNIASAIARVQSQLTLLQTRQSTLRNIMEFSGGSSGPDSLTAQIDEMERAIPKTPEGQGQSSGTAAPSASAGPQKEDSGLWSIFGRLMETSRKIQTIRAAIRQTNQLSQGVKEIQAPLRKQLEEVLHESEVNMSEPVTLDAAVLAGQKSALDASNARFKLIAAALLPLSKQQILLQSYRKTLQDWNAAVGSEYSAQWKGLIVRLLILGIVLAVVLGAFAVWRRAIIRYIPDLSRRYQFMVMRKIALGIVICLILLIAFASQLGSLATFAGLLTAGLAVALQNLFLAVAGYFILIGKFGVRVGDRVQITDVKGQVVEIGILRLHLLEVSGMDADAQPSGRIVAFANSVVFQPLAGFCKLVPGASLVWRDISFTVAHTSDYRSVERRVFAAVHAALKEYQPGLEQLRSKMERSLESISIGSLQPKIQFRITQTGVGINIRFPAELRRAGEISSRITAELLRAAEQEPKLTIIEAESPAIQQPIDLSAVDEPSRV